MRNYVRLKFGVDKIVVVKVKDEMLRLFGYMERMVKGKI